MTNFNRNKPTQMLLYEVLLRRAIVEESVRREWETKFHALRTGYIGERRVDNEWREVNVQGTLLHDFTCRNRFGNTHQMDTVFICKHFVLIVEVKNVAGRIDFDDNRRQFLRTREDGTVESFNNPIDQVKRHRDLLLEFSVDWPFYVPIEAFIVIANPSTVIGRLSNEIPVFNVTGLRTKVAELVKKHASVNLNVRAVRNLLEELYEPIERTVKLDYPIRTGVFCLKCGKVMHMKHRGFKCEQCDCYDQDDRALLQAMSDYRVLYGNRIRNHEFRRFVGVESPKTANSLLKKLFKQRDGTMKGRVYFIPNDVASRKFR